MSLKAFHIFFIFISIGMAAGFGYWGIRDYTVSGETWNLVLGIFSAAGSVGLIYYLARFLVKSKTWTQS